MHSIVCMAMWLTTLKREQLSGLVMIASKFRSSADKPQPYAIRAVAAVTTTCSLAVATSTTHVRNQYGNEVGALPLHVADPKHRPLDGGIGITRPALALDECSTETGQLSSPVGQQRSRAAGQQHVSTTAAASQWHDITAV
jgi:hypothetical protein